MPRRLVERGRQVSQAVTLIRVEAIVYFNLPSLLNDAPAKRHGWVGLGVGAGMRRCSLCPLSTHLTARDSADSLGSSFNVLRSDILATTTYLSAYKTMPPPPSTTQGGSNLDKSELIARAVEAWLHGHPRTPNGSEDRPVFEMICCRRR